MRYGALIILLLCISALAAQSMLFENDRAVIKIAPQYKHQLHLSPSGTGIAELDNQLIQLGIKEIRPRFQYDPKRPGSADLALILELRFDASLHPWAVCNALSGNKYLQYVEPIYIDETQDAPNDYFYAYSRYFDVLQAEAAWAVHKGENGSSETIIAVVDTSVNWKHPDLGQNIWQNLAEDANGNGYTIYWTGSTWAFDPGDLDGIDNDGNGKVDDLIGWDFMADSAFSQDNDPYGTGHGTVVAGVANARTNNSGIGVASLAWNVRLMPLKCSFSGSSSIYRGYDAIIYAAEMGADVINCSWGSMYYSQAGQDAVDYAWGLGSVIVAAAGNNNDLIPLYPSALRNVVAVGTVRNTGVHTGSTYGIQLDVVAPVDSIYSFSGTGYAYAGTATSYATPIISSLAALVKSYFPLYTNQQVVARIAATCDNIYPANPGSKLNLLGYGRPNAYRALTDVSPTPTPGLKLAIRDFGIPTDANANKAIEPNEQFSLNLVLRNFAVTQAATNLNITVTTTDPGITILNGSLSTSISADGELTLTNAFLLQTSPTIQSRYVRLNLNCSAEVPVLVGAVIPVDVLINAGGIYVWEGYAGRRNMSGTWIKGRLDALGRQNTLGKDYGITGDSFPASLLGFDAAFLSFGVRGQLMISMFSQKMFDSIRAYLLSGGRLYIEGGDVIGNDIALYYPDVDGTLDGWEVLWPLLGISSADNGSTNPVNLLSSPNGWHTNGLQFTGSNQTTFQSMDSYTPNQNGIQAFEEDGYGCVAVQSIGAYGQRVFASSYAIAELVDGSAPNTRSELLNRIMTFLLDAELTLPDVTDLSIEQVGTDVRLQWDYPFPVDAFDVYSDAHPYGTFSTLANSNAAKEAVMPATVRRFFRVRARRQFGL